MPARHRATDRVFDGIEIAGEKSHAIARRGIQPMQEDRRIFGSLSVEGNLMLAGLMAENRWPLARIVEMFPRVKERRGSRGTDPSGGEPQMLAFARALLVEQNLAATLTLASRVYIVDNGHMAHEGSARGMRAQPEILHRYLGV
ncbi:MAG TPA: hypothetical protein VFB29_05250 [Pseudolabrys sp.]|nr:hypothetical protein [Pseudolabrys sp.]